MINTANLFYQALAKIAKEDPESLPIITKITKDLLYHFHDLPTEVEDKKDTKKIIEEAIERRRRLLPRSLASASRRSVPPRSPRAPPMPRSRASPVASVPSRAPTTSRSEQERRSSATDAHGHSVNCR